MTYDLVVLTGSGPDLRDIAAGMTAAGTELGVRQVAEGAVIQLCDEEENPLVSVETPVLVQVPGEVERVLHDLSTGPVSVPVWWTELRASGTEQAVTLAYAFADELAGRLDGLVWAGTARPLDGPSEAQA